jgi:hypothetical protein
MSGGVLAPRLTRGNEASLPAIKPFGLVSPHFPLLRSGQAFGAGLRFAFMLPSKTDGNMLPPAKITPRAGAKAGSRSVIAQVPKNRNLRTPRGQAPGLRYRILDFFQYEEVWDRMCLVGHGRFLIPGGKPHPRMSPRGGRPRAGLRFAFMLPSKTEGNMLPPAKITPRAGAKAGFPRSGNLCSARAPARITCGSGPNADAGRQSTENTQRK